MPWDLLNPSTEYVSQEIYDLRMEECKSCENFIKTTSQCKKCGCFMKIKSAMGHAFCPIDKWKSEV